MKEAEQIVSSTGDLGVSRRSFDRLYLNGTKFIESPHLFQAGATRVAEMAERRRLDRTVFRGIVSADVMGLISQELRQHVEVAMPLGEFTGDNSWLVSLAQNDSSRTPIVPIELMQQETALQRDTITSPLGRVEKLAGENFSFTDRIEEADIPQIYALWGDTFGWDAGKKEVEALQHRLNAGQLINPSDRNVWFSAVKDEEAQIAGIAMAERLSRPGEQGTVDIVESTEWRVNPKYKGKGIMPATIALLNAQILSDLQGNPKKGPLIYAECNFASRADRVGSSAGFRIPSREHAQQVLVQNVAVGDGMTLGTPLRDFTFMYLGKNIITDHYSQSQRKAMLGNLNRK